MKIPGGLKHANNSRPWEADELNRLRQLIEADIPFPLMSAMLGRSQEALKTKARKLRLTICPCCRDKLPGSGRREHS